MMYIQRGVERKWTKGVSYRETRRPRFPLRRVRPCISSYREVWGWPLPGEGREICSRKTKGPNDFRLAKEIHEACENSFTTTAYGSGYLSQTELPRPVIGLEPNAAGQPN